MIKNTCNLQRNYTIEDLEALLDEAPYEIWLKDDNGKYIYINKLGAEKTGLSKENIIGKTDYEIRDYDIAKKCIETDRMLTDKNQYLYNEEHGNIDGQYICYKVNKLKLKRHTDNNNILAGIAEEITLDRSIQLELENNLLGYWDKDRTAYDSSAFLETTIEKLKKTASCKGIEAFAYDEYEKKFSLYYSSSKENSRFEKNSEIYINEEIENKLCSIEFKKDRYSEIYDKIAQIQKYNNDDKLKIKHVKLSNNLVGIVCIFYDKNLEDISMDEAVLEQILTKISIILKQIKNKDEILLIKQKEKKLEDLIELECIKTDFFANISHEFRTPINVMLSTIQLLQSNNEGRNINFNYKNYLKILKQNSYRLLRLVNNSIDTARLSNNFYDLRLENHNIISVVEDITMSAAKYVEQTKRSIVFDTDEEEVILACDLDKIERIILNLISNAIKFSEANTEINVQIKTDLKARKVFISVKNYGEVIKKNDREIVFGKCIQIDDLLVRRAEGTGMGLFLVRKFAELHKGGIYIDDIEDYTQFTFYLPIETVDGECIYNRGIDENSVIEKCNM